MNYQKSVSNPDLYSLSYPRQVKPLGMIKSCIELMKLRMSLMVMVAVFIGYFLGNPTPILFSWNLFWTLFGSASVAAGIFTVNQIMEIEIDQKMNRTKNRPLPSRRISPTQAAWFSGMLIFIGLSVFLLFVGFLPFLLTALIAISYTALYTPLKTINWLSTPVGAIPGAIPPLIGWSAANQSLSTEAWILFFILFAWQHPHFYAIGWIYKNEYKNAGIQILPVVEPDGKSVSLQSLLFSFFLIPISLSLKLFTPTSEVYTYGVLLIGLIFFYFTLAFAIRKTIPSAKALLYASLFYLPLYLGILTLDAQESKKMESNLSSFSQKLE